MTIAVYAASVLCRSPFSAKIKSGFWICYSMQFGVFPVSLRKICASTTSIARTSSLILPSVFGFDGNLFGFAVFYHDL